MDSFEGDYLADTYGGKSSPKKQNAATILLNGMGLAKKTAEQIIDDPDKPYTYQNGGDNPYRYTTTNNYPLGGYGGSGYGYGGKSAEDQQKELQAAINNFVTNSSNRFGDLVTISENSLGTIGKTAEENKNSYLRAMQLINQLNDWQPNQQREQSVYRAIKNRMGNALNGSAFADLNEGMSRYDDMADVELMKSIKENGSSAFDNFRNAQISLYGDNEDQINAIQDEFSKFKSSFHSTLSSLNSLLDAEALKEKNKGKSVTVGSGTDKYTMPAINLEIPDNLRALMVSLDIPNAFDPFTGKYIRPDRAVNEANKIGNTGRANKASIAHREFGNEMDAYKRRV